MGLSGEPEADPGDDTAFLSDRALGIELTFTDEAALDPPAQRDYPAGAWILVNIRLYGRDDSDFSRYTGILPFGLTFGMRASQAVATLGGGYRTFLDGELYRWDREGYCIFCEFAGDRLEEVSVQRPVPADMR